MIHLLLLTGAAGASSSASIEKVSVGGVAAGASTAIGVGAGSSAEIDTPGRALAAGKCCKRAAKLKRKKLQLKMEWETCKKAADATPTLAPRFKTAWLHESGTTSTSPERWMQRRAGDCESSGPSRSAAGWMVEYRACGGGRSSHSFVPWTRAFHAQRWKWCGDPVPAWPT